MPRYTLCPYYIDENNKSISCEDVCRSFNSMKKKWRWMDMYCDSWDWMKCPYAADISEAYRKAEEGDAMAIENQEIKAQKKEIESLLRKLGRANKRIERMQKKIDDLRAVNKSYMNKNDDLYRKWRLADDKQRNQDNKILNELGSLTAIYEQRMCYLIDKFAPEGITEKEIEQWAADKEFALVADFVDDGKEIAWKVVFNDGQQDQDIQADVQEGQEIRQQEGTD